MSETCGREWCVSPCCIANLTFVLKSTYSTYVSESLRAATWETNHWTISTACSERTFCLLTCHAWSNCNKTAGAVDYMHRRRIWWIASPLDVLRRLVRNILVWVATLPFHNAQVKENEESFDTGERRCLRSMLTDTEVQKIFRGFQFPGLRANFLTLHIEVASCESRWWIAGLLRKARDTSGRRCSIFTRGRCAGYIVGVAYRLAFYDAHTDV